MNWNTTLEDDACIMAIVKRSNERDRMSLAMDITAVHLNGNPLNLTGLLMAEDGDFFHDIFGIARNIDRNTGKLTNCFVPRFSK